MDENEPLENPAPEDPFSTMDSMAAAVHEYFTALQSVGFTSMEALYLSGVWITALANSNKPTV